MKRHLIPLVLAAAVLVACARCGPDKSIKYYNLGLEAVERRDYEQAIALWKESLARRPDDPETRYNLGLALMNVGRREEAEQQLRAAVALSPLDQDSHQLLGKCLEEQGKLGEAKLAYESSLNIAADNVPSLIGLASIARTENRNRAMEEYATRAIGLDPNNIEGNLLLSEAFLRNGDYNAAYAQIISTQRLGANNPSRLLLLGKIYYARRMYADAIAALDDARTLGASGDETYVYRGLSALALENTAQAEEDFRLAIYRNAESALAWKGLGEVYLKEKKWREASEAIDKAARLAPDDPEISLHQAILALEWGDQGAAAIQLENLRERSGAPAITDYYLAHAYLRLGREADSRAAFERFIAAWEGDGALVEESKTILQRLAP